MLQHYRQKFASLSTSLIVGLLTVGLPNLSQAATFELTVDGLEGSGTITFDDVTLKGKGIEEISLDDLYFDWSFVIGEGVYTTITENVITGELTQTDTFFPVTLQNGSKSAYGGLFIFQDGELVDIDNYEWFTLTGNVNSKGGEETELYIDNGVVSIYSKSSSGLDDSFVGDLYIQQFDGWDIVRENLPYQIATIVPWQDPNQSIPEPGLTAGFIVMGLGLLYQKSKA